MNEPIASWDCAIGCHGDCEGYGAGGDPTKLEPCACDCHHARPSVDPDDDPDGDLLRAEESDMQLRRTSSSLVQRSIALCTAQKHRTAVFLVMREIDRLLSEQDFQACRVILDEARKSIGALTPEVTGAILSITYAARRSLTGERQAFYVAVRDDFVRRFEIAKVRRLLDHLA